MASCNNDCSSCSSECGERKEPQSLIEPANKYSDIKKVIAVVSGKGGVGKSSVTSLLASSMAKRGKKVAVLDADITGPSIPKAFGVSRGANGCDWGIVPAQTPSGIKIMSLNMLLEHETDPVVWRGPLIAGTVKQFWTDVYWGEIDCMLIDMPPGTGDVPLTVFQSLPINGAVIVTTPQSLVNMIVEKSVNMAKLMNIPVLGLVENMSYLTCPDCGRKLFVFGESRVEKTARDNGIENFISLPIDPAFAERCDSGTVEGADTGAIDAFAAKITE